MWKVFIFQHISFYEQLEFHAQLTELRWAWKKNCNLRARADIIVQKNYQLTLTVPWLFAATTTFEPYKTEILEDR